MRPGWLPVNKPKSGSTRDQQQRSIADDVSIATRHCRPRVLDEQSPAGQCRHCQKPSGISTHLIGPSHIITVNPAAIDEPSATHARPEPAALDSVVREFHREPAGRGPDWREC